MHVTQIGYGRGVRLKSALSVAFIAILLLVSGCASIDYDYPRTESTAILDTADTRIGTTVAGLTESVAPGLSGFHTLNSGIDAFGSRLLLADRAERTIDTQYYLIKPDVTGKAFVYTLLKAADRGVRVRLLVDDMFVLGKDRGLVALDAHPNFEIRIVNPFRRGIGGFVWTGLTGFSRATRRMHAKSFTVDSQVTILGGRNIADEYFGASRDSKFGDLDIIGIGPIAPEVSRMFDTFWNHETALPLPAFAKMPDDPQAELQWVRAELAEAFEAARQTRYAAAISGSVEQFIEGYPKSIEWAPYQLVYDSPDKHLGADRGPDENIVTPLAEAVFGAQKELLIVTPYFVPRDEGINRIIELEKRGVDVTIVTNSLVANNHTAVHGDYAPSRKPLLRNGVRIFELKQNADFAGTEFAEEDSRATLHTKAFFVDREQSFIGSFNFNQRSVNRDSENGVIVESERISSGFMDAIYDAVGAQAWEVFLNEDGDLRWRGYDDGQEVIYEKEPESSWFMRFKATVARILPIKSQL